MANMARFIEVHEEDGEPYEKPTPTQDDRERLENLLGNSPMGTEATTEYLLSHGVAFREG